MGCLLKGPERTGLTADGRARVRLALYVSLAGRLVMAANTMATAAASGIRIIRIL